MYDDGNGIGSFVLKTGAFSKPDPDRDRGEAGTPVTVYLVDSGVQIDMSVSDRDLDALEYQAGNQGFVKVEDLNTGNTVHIAQGQIAALVVGKPMR